MLAKVTSGVDALDAVVTHRPDVLVTSVRLADPDLDGIKLIRQATDEVSGLRCVVISAYDDATHVGAAFAAGACAYVVKTAHPHDIASAVRQAFDSSIFLASPAATHNGKPTGNGADSGYGLTRREVEILRLVAEGHSNAELARRVWITEQTVKFHLSNIYRKLGVANRTEAGRWAQLNGVLGSDDLTHA